jgi:GntP family gluconate:H+ symporter
LNIWLLLILAVTTVLLGILWLRLHPFLALLLAGLLVAVGTTPDRLRQHAESRVGMGKLTADAAERLVQSPAPERLARAFGDTVTSVGILIALASVIGACLLESGAAMRIVDSGLSLVGVRRAPLALAGSSFLLGIPVFFDTVFYLMVPLARSLCRRTGRDYVLFILAIMAGGSIAHSLVPPTPGPLQVAAILEIDLWALMVGGLAVGALSSVFSLGSAWGINRLVDVPLREIEGGRVSEVSPTADDGGDAPEGPPLLLCLLPILLPLVLIAAGTATNLWVSAGPSAAADAGVAGWRATLVHVVQFAGDKNIALGIATLLALSLLRYAPADSDRRRVVAEAISSGGVIILITAAGGAFGAMLGQAGIAESVARIDTTAGGLWLLPLAFLVTTAIRTIQGSATVAMITAAGILQGLASSEALPFHPVYLAMAIGGGSKPISWMTDSGFWLMCKMSGMTEAEGLRTVTPLTIAMGLSTLFWTMLAAWLLPMV